MFKAQGKYQEALPLYNEALETRRAVLGSRHPDALTSINNLASLLQATGDLDRAEELLSEAHTTAKSVLGPEHPHTRIFGVNLKGLRAVKKKAEKKAKKQLTNRGSAPAGAPGGASAADSETEEAPTPAEA